MSTTMTEPMDEAKLHEFVMKAVGGNGGRTRTNLSPKAPLLVGLLKCGANGSMELRR